MMIEQVEAAKQMVVDALIGNAAIRETALTMSRKRIDSRSTAHLIKRRSA
jgi:hypothetical protein